MKTKRGTIVKAIVYFLLLVFARPVLLDRKISAVWILGSAGISLVIAVLPEYLVARLKRATSSEAFKKRKSLPVILGIWQKTWIRISGEVLFIFGVLVFIGPTVKNGKANAAWLIIAAITAVAGGIIGDYLNGRIRRMLANKSRKRKEHKKSEWK